MDANQTRFHLLLGQSDWVPAAVRNDTGIFPIPASNLEWDDIRHELRLRSELFRFKAKPRDDAPTQDERRGSAADSYLNWYWIAASRKEIRVQSSGEAAPAHFWSADDAIKPAQPSGATFHSAEPLLPIPANTYTGLAVTEDQYLLVGTLEPAGLIVFDLFGGGPPRIICWPKEIAFAPFDMVPRSGGGVWILDRENMRFWALDRTLRVITNGQTDRTLSEAQNDVFQPVQGEHRIAAAQTFPEGIALSYASPMEAQDPVAIEALPDGSVLILDAPVGGVSRVLRYRFAERLGEVPLDFQAYDFAIGEGRLYIASAEGNQAFAFAVGELTRPLKLSPLGEYFPMRRFGGKAMVAAGNRVFYDFGERWLPLTSQVQPRYAAEAFVEFPAPREGVQGAFDGHEPQCVWHRLMLDACLPPGTDVQIQSRAANTKQDLERAPWQAEPSLHRRGTGSELPFTPAPVSRDRGTFELLLQNARGRFLQVRLQLVGDRRVTPRLHALRIYYPRFSYLERYLPAVYREDAASASFLDRFLANFEGTFTAIEDRIAAVEMLFDVRSTPPEALTWLASWFGVVLDPAWNETRRRLFLTHAMEFFQWRGTVHGLRTALRLAFEEHPDEHIFDPPGAKCRCGDRFRIVEKFLTRWTPAVELGDPTDVAGGPSFAPAGGRWKPEQGTAALYARYRAATGRETFTLTPLADAAAEAARTAFAQRELGFIPSDLVDEIAAWSDYQQSRNFTPMPLPDREPASNDLAELWRVFQIATDSEPYGRQRRMWQQFLARRYVSVLALNAAHATDWKRFDAVAYPSALPQNLAQLHDWYEFETRVLPTLAAAHRFTVLLPVTTAAGANDEDRGRQLALASRIVELEKPAHTVFEVKFYWALFRVGEARLGYDSVPRLGGRDPALFPQPVVLGQSYLAERLVATDPPPSTPGRIVAGRDRLPRKKAHLQ
jgi:phage tail-like protein